MASETKQAESIEKHETNHSPLPWSRVGFRVKADSMWYTSRGYMGGASVLAEQKYMNLRIANARLIVTAVNFHERLVACAKDAAELLGAQSFVATDIRSLLSEISKAAE